ncbi:hypothetical protein BT93_J0617 [Corymbia citriodora subsp. variegata]|nr:hypothetical protein BT93_J0617 [Corymbia citriodora subsp. variegata]
MGSKTSDRQLAPKVLFFLLIMFMSSSIVNSITCQGALNVLLPCGPFVVFTAPPPPSEACCLGVQTLGGKMTTMEVRIALCKCCKNIPLAIGLKPERVQELPKYCKVNVNIPIDAKVDCNT